MLDSNNLGGGSGFHLVTSSTTKTLAPIKTSHLVGHSLRLFAYGNITPGEDIRVAINDTIIAVSSPEVDSFVLEILMVIDETENKVISQMLAPITDTNNRMVVSKFTPALPENVIFTIHGSSQVHHFACWKLGLRD